MKHFKKSFVALALAFAAFTVSAQSSNTSTATESIFKTDVDYFMDVNNWNKVKPENGFGYFGLEYSSYYLGFAKQFDNIYLGSYFSGDFGNYEKTVTKTSDNTTVDIKEGNTESTSFYYYNLIGTGNLGIKLGFHYYNYNSNETDDGTTKEYSDNAVWSIYSRFGSTSTIQLGKLNVLPYAAVNFYFNDNYETKKKTGDVIKDPRDWQLYGLVGGSAILSSDEVKETSISSSLSFALTNPVNKDEKENADGYESNKFEFTLPVEYKVVLKPTEKLSLGARTRLTTSFDFGKVNKDNSYTNLELDPAIYVGLQYDTLKKFVFNTGASFAVPSFTYGTTSNSDTDKKTSTAKWDGNDASIGTWTGFQFNPINGLSFDCIWNVISGVLGNDLTTDFKEGDGVTPPDDNIFWENVNKLFVHNVRFVVSYKF